MVEILSLLGIGIALSMDTFSLSLSIGTFGINNRKSLLLAAIVGVMHFIMPTFGLIIGKIILGICNFNTRYLMSIILLILAFLMTKELKNNKQPSIVFSLIGILIFSLSVSIDSFTTGIGLRTITNNIFLSLLIFSICSFLFTYLGLVIGKYSHQKLGKKATLFGIILLIIVAIGHIF